MEVIKDERYNIIKLSQEQLQRLKDNIKIDLLKVIFKIKGKRDYSHYNFNTMFREELNIIQKGFLEKVNFIIQDFEKTTEIDKRNFFLKLEQQVNYFCSQHDLCKQVDNLYKRLFLIEERIMIIEKKMKGDKNSKTKQQLEIQQRGWAVCCAGTAVQCLHLNGTRISI